MSYVKNVGFVDQIVRALIILDIVAAYLMGFVSGIGAFLSLTIALILGASCLVGYCPVYGFLRLSTRQEYENRR
jgi:hypothetical protein